MTIRVVIADDHAIIRDGVAALIDVEPDIELVGTASDGLEAIKLVEKTLPDVVVTDIMMPGLNGIEATERIRNSHPNTQVIILSIRSTASDIVRSLRAGARGYLLKESAGSDIANAIRRVHSGSYYLTPEITTVVLEDYLQQRGDPAELSPLERLSPREREVLQLVAEGKTSAEIAILLTLSPKTVDTYRARVMQKLGLNNMVELLHFAVQHGLIDWQ
jgi:DNA-binding NarL/FixJ family response regulator